MSRGNYNKGKISRVEMIFAMFFTIFFIGLIYYKPQIIGWYSIENKNINLVETLFVLERLRFYMIGILLLAFVQLGIHILKFIKKKWTLPIAMYNAAYNIGTAVLYSTMALDPTLFNKGFISQFVQLTNTSSAVWSKLTLGVSIAIIAGCIIDSIVGFVKCRKST
jgi:hypothetical protein